jgi:hypothetical protein
MKTLLIIAAGLVVAMGVRAAEGAEKPAKPVVCAAYEIVRPGLAVCSDSKRPFLMRSFSELSIPGKDGGSIKVLVGWR